MYLPSHFVQDDPEPLYGLIAASPLGTWIERDGDATLVNHVPFMRMPGGPTGNGVLVGHVARANPVWRALSGRAGIVVFQGPQAYVSPSWYPSKAVHHKVVPTWNYAVVHAHGVARAVEDRARLREIVERLTQTHETGREAPWKVGDAPADFIESMLSAIVGIEIPIDALVGKWKVSQNRTAADRAGVAAGLRASTRDGGAHEDPASAAAPADASARAVASLVDPARGGAPHDPQPGASAPKRHDAAS